MLWVSTLILFLHALNVNVYCVGAVIVVQLRPTEIPMALPSEQHARWRASQAMKALLKLHEGGRVSGHKAEEDAQAEAQAESQSEACRASRRALAAPRKRTNKSPARYAARRALGQWLVAGNEMITDGVGHVIEETADQFDQDMDPVLDRQVMTVILVMETK